MVLGKPLGALGGRRKWWQGREMGNVLVASSLHEHGGGILFWVAICATLSVDRPRGLILYWAVFPGIAFIPGMGRRYAKGRHRLGNLSEDVYGELRLSFHCVGASLQSYGVLALPLERPSGAQAPRADCDRAARSAWGFAWGGPSATIPARGPAGPLEFFKTLPQGSPPMTGTPTATHSFEPRPIHLVGLPRGFFLP